MTTKETTKQLKNEENHNIKQPDINELQHIRTPPPTKKSAKTKKQETKKKERQEARAARFALLFHKVEQHMGEAPEAEAQTRGDHQCHEKPRRLRQKEL